MQSTYRACVLVLLLAVLASDASGGSIFRASRKRSASLYRDDKASTVGDIVTIVIDEEHKVDNSSDRALNKSDKRSLKIENGDQLDILRGINAATGKLMNLPKLDFSANGSSDYSGGTKFGSERKIEDEITVVVEDVLPNGNLVVVGKQVRSIEGETQTTQISGIIRPSDISYANKITSRRVANFYIETVHKGQESQFTQPGWLAKILNFINPF
jgi:flagellar L-ring protein precursor FlgH